MKKVSLLAAVTIIMLFSIFSAVSASDTSSILQDEVRGSIRGTVYEDRNADGVCVGTGEPTLGGINIQFVSDDGRSTVHLQSGFDGSYGLVAVGLGTWTVSAVPLTGFSVSSENPQVVFLSTEQPDVSGVDFCIIKGSGGSEGGTVVLPESGGAVAPPFILAVLGGFSLIAAGTALEIRRRRAS